MKSCCCEWRTWRGRDLVKLTTPLSYAITAGFQSIYLRRLNEYKFFLHMDLCQRYIVRKVSIMIENFKKISCYRTPIDICVYAADWVE